MALTHPTNVRNAVCNLVVDLVDAGAGAGYLELVNVDDEEVAKLVFSDPAFGNAVNGIAVADTVSDDADAAGGNAIAFNIKDSNDALVIAGTFGPVGADLTGGSAVIGAGDVVSIEDGELSYEAMP